MAKLSAIAAVAVAAASTLAAPLSPSHVSTGPVGVNVTQPPSPFSFNVTLPGSNFTIPYFKLNPNDTKPAGLNGDKCFQGLGTPHPHGAYHAPHERGYEQIGLSKPLLCERTIRFFHDNEWEGDWFDTNFKWPMGTCINVKDNVKWVDDKEVPAQGHLFNSMYQGPFTMCYFWRKHACTGGPDTRFGCLARNGPGSCKTKSIYFPIKSFSCWPKNGRKRFHSPPPNVHWQQTWKGDNNYSHGDDKPRLEFADKGNNATVADIHGLSSDELFESSGMVVNGEAWMADEETILDEEGMVVDEE